MATLAGSKILTVDKMEQTIDIRRYLGRDATTKEKRAFIEVAIERINNRTLDHETIHGGRFKKYSPEYAAIKGVTEDNVDLFLNGDMLGSLVGEYDSSNRITLKVVGELQVKKAFNHHTGDTQKKRPWFGITTGEMNQIISEIKDQNAPDSTSLASLLALDRAADAGEEITEESLASIISGIRLQVLDEDI